MGEYITGIIDLIRSGSLSSGVNYGETSSLFTEKGGNTLFCPTPGMKFWDVIFEQWIQSSLPK